MQVLAEPTQDNKILRELETSVSTLTGKSPADLRDSSIEGYRHEREIALQHPLRITSRFPFIGRGNVLRDRILDQKKIEKQLDAILG